MRLRVDRSPMAAAIQVLVGLVLGALNALVLLRGRADGYAPWHIAIVIMAAGFIAWGLVGLLRARRSDQPRW